MLIVISKQYFRIKSFYKDYIYIYKITIKKEDTGKKKFLDLRNTHLIQKENEK
jgi:hypothetical protein